MRGTASTTGRRRRPIGLGAIGGPRELWVVNHYAFGPDHPTGSRHYDLARRAASEGWHVTIFAAGRSHLSRQEERVSGLRLSASGHAGGVRFVWLRTFPYRGNDWRRQLNMLSFLLMFLVAQARAKDPDVIVGSTVHPFAALGAWMAARLRGAAFVFEIRDLWPQTLVDLGALRVGSPGERLLRALESHLVRHASAVITLLPGARDYLERRGLPSGHVVYIPNGVDLDAFRPGVVLPPDAPPDVVGTLSVIERFRSSGAFVVGYVGSFGRVNNLRVVIDAARLADEQAPGRVRVILMGGGTERGMLERRAGWGQSAVIAPPVPKPFVPAILAALDATIVHTTSTPVYQYGISFNKLFEYMAAGRPVLFACTSAYDPISETGAGITSPPDDPEYLARALISLAGTPKSVLQEMGRRARLYVEREHNLDRLGASFVATIDGASRRQRGPDRDQDAA